MKEFIQKQFCRQKEKSDRLAAMPIDLFKFHFSFLRVATKGECFCGGAGRRWDLGGKQSPIALNAGSIPWSVVHAPDSHWHRE